MLELRANTAIDLLIGPFVATGDGFTAITTGTIDVELSKLGQPLADKNDATDPTHDAAGDIDGMWNCELDATDTNAEGMLTLVAYVSTALICRHEYMVLDEEAWDAKYVDGEWALIQAGIDAAVADLANGTDGLGALKALIDTVNTDLGNGTDGLGALKTLIDTVNTDLGNGTDGLGALKSLIDAIPTTAMRGTDDAATEAKQDTMDTVVDGIQTDLSNSTDGLGALKTLIDAVNTDLGNGTDGLGALKALLDAIPTTAMRGTDDAATEAKQDTMDTVVDGIQTDLANGTDGLGALKALLDAIPTTAMRGTDDAATEAKQDTMDTVVDGIQTDLSNGTDGLGALKALIDTAQADLTALKKGIIFGTAEAGTLSKTQCTSDIAGYADNDLLGAVIVFDSGDADGCRATITGNAATDGLISFAAGINTTVAADDTFKIV